MKLLILPLILQFAGVAVVFAEIFIPSGGLLSLLAAGLFGYSLFIVFTDISTVVGGYFLAADIIGLPILIYIGVQVLARSSLTLQQTLSRQDGVISQDPNLQILINHKGEALADLRPSGHAKIDNQRVDVISRGEYIRKGRAIIVVAVTGNQIIVKEQ